MSRKILPSFTSIVSSRRESFSLPDYYRATRYEKYGPYYRESAPQDLMVCRPTYSMQPSFVSNALPLRQPLIIEDVKAPTLRRDTSWYLHLDAFPAPFQLTQHPQPDIFEDDEIELESKSEHRDSDVKSADDDHMRHAEAVQCQHENEKKSKWVGCVWVCDISRFWRLHAAYNPSSISSPYSYASVVGGRCTLLRTYPMCILT